MTKYRHHKYTWSKPFMAVRHDWSFVGPLGAVNFWASLTPGYGDNAGIEYHHTEACQARPDDAPDHISCPLTGGRCWHDGGSLYAMERLWPQAQTYLDCNDQEAIFEMLEREANRHFEGFALAQRRRFADDGATSAPLAEPDEVNRST